MRGWSDSPPLPYPALPDGPRSRGNYEELEEAAGSRTAPKLRDGLIAARSYEILEEAPSEWRIS